MITRITALFNIKLPLICPGMTYIAVPELVAAVSNAGGLGILATGPLNQTETKAAIEKVRSLTDKPFGVGCTLMMPGAVENAKIALEMQVPVINYSLGKGDWICQAAHQYGGKVIATVTTEKHAISAQKSGADALLVTGHEAAAHGGEVTSLVLIPAIRRASTLPIIAAGGFASGQGLIAALALGADAIAMGTRLAMTKESPVHQNTKEAIQNKSIHETIYSRHFDGLWCRVMDTPLARQKTKRPIPLLTAAYHAMTEAQKMKLPVAKTIVGGVLTRPMALRQLALFGAATQSIRTAIQEGNMHKGVQLIGQAQGLIDDVPTVGSLFDRIQAEANTAMQHLNKL